MRRYLTNDLLPIFLLGLCALHAPAARVSLKLDVKEAYVNETIIAQLIVQDFENCLPPDFPDIPNCDIQPSEPSTSTQTTIINGRMTTNRTRTYAYQITPRQQGTLRIPPIKVVADGKPYQTRPVTLPVLQGDSSQLFQVEIKCDEQTVYVGQEINLKLIVYVKPPRSQARGMNARELSRLIRAVDLGPFPREEVRIGQATLPDENNQRTLYYTYTLETDYVPDRPGPLRFDSVDIMMEYPIRIVRDLFGTPQVQNVRRLRAVPETPEIQVLPLPAAGRPANFSGAVGKFALQVTAQPTTVRVGDPITLTLTIQGDGPIQTLPPPLLSADPRLSRDFRIPREELAGEVLNPRTKRFTQVIRASDPDVNAIPPIEYPFFNPHVGKYQTTQSRPIALTVLPTESVDPAEDLVGMAVPTPEGGASSLRALDGLLGNETSESALLTKITPVRRGAVIAVTAIPAAVFLAAWVALTMTARDADARGRRQRRAYKAARSRIEAATAQPPTRAASEIQNAFADYLGTRLKEPAGRFIGKPAIDAIAQLRAKPKTQTLLANLLDACEQSAFGAASADSQTLANQALECLNTLDRERF